MTKFRVSVMIAVASAFVSTAGNAIESLTAEELASHCVVLPEGTDTVDGQFCIRYIQGFIDGAVATDIRVMLNIEAASKPKSKESFSERAFRTRSSSRESRRRAASYAEFCLGDPVPLAEVVAKVTGDLNERLKAMDSAGTARDLVYESLRRNYPCEAAS